MEAATDRGTAKHGLAWLLLCGALALHVTDEALTGFLSVWNPLVRALRERVSFLPLPTFTFGVWLGGLIAAVLVLFALSRFAFRGARWMIPLSYFFGIMMLGNGLFHLMGSVYLGALMPGAYSSPLLLAASAYLLIQTYRRRGIHAT